MMDNSILNDNGEFTGPNSEVEGRAGKKKGLLFKAGLPVDVLR